MTLATYIAAYCDLQLPRDSPARADVTGHPSIFVYRTSITHIDTGQRQTHVEHTDNNQFWHYIHETEALH